MVDPQKNPQSSDVPPMLSAAAGIPGPLGQQSSSVPPVPTPPVLDTSSSQSLPTILPPTTSPTLADPDWNPKNDPIDKAGGLKLDAKGNPIPGSGPTGWLQKIGRLAGGALGLEDPGSSPQAGMGAKIMSLAGHVGNALSAAGGTAEQQRETGERVQIPLKLAQIENERQYREAVMANNVAKTKGQYAVGDPNDLNNPEGTQRQAQDSHAIMAAAAAQNAASNEDLRNAHARQIEAQMNGKVFVTKEAAHAAGDDSLANTQLPAMQYTQRITNPINNQLKAAGGAKTVDLGADGVWGYNAFTGKTTRQGDSPSVARSDAMMKRSQMPMRDQQGNVTGYFNAPTQTFTALDGTVSHGVPPEALGGNTSASGQSAMAPMPSGNVLTRGQVSQTILPMIPVMEKQVLALSDQIGAAGGRWNDFWVNKGGINDPAFSKMDQNLHLFASAVAMAHFGGAAPDDIVQGLRKDFGEAQSPEDLNARIEASESWIRGYAERVGGGPKTAPSSSGTPAKPTSGGGGFSAWDKNNPAPKTAGAK